MNSAHVIHLAFLLQHAIAGHHFHPWAYVATWCVSHPPGLALPHLSRAGCFVLYVTQRSVSIRW
jgi:hypothetical protein